MTKKTILRIDYKSFYPVGLYKVNNIRIWSTLTYGDTAIFDLDGNNYEVPVKSIEYISGYLPNDLKPILIKDYIIKPNVKKGGVKMPRILKYICYIAIVSFIWRFFTSIDVNLLIKGIYKLFGINL